MAATQLTAYGNLTGKRLAALIGLRDKARRVLQSQNEGWPEEARQEARRELNWAYDRFAFAYGPINKTTFSETKDGGVIRRMPNIVKFREDPDAMLVCSLEEYDEETGKAAKAAILTRDVVGKTPPVTPSRSAEEGLLVSLEPARRGRSALHRRALRQAGGAGHRRAGRPDLPRPGIEDLADGRRLSLGQRPRRSSTAAEAAGPDYARNVEALRAVQPEDVLPGDIDCQSGCPWIPESDIRDFAAQLFRVEPESIQVGHLKKDAVWTLDAGYAAQASVAAKSEYGTERANGTWLLELALNMRTPTVYDPDPDDPDKRVVNQEATLAAREKQKLIKEKFRQWTFADPERTERLVRMYNDSI